jgi:hypothetical protein
MTLQWQRLHRHIRRLQSIFLLRCTMYLCLHIQTALRIPHEDDADAERGKGWPVAVTTFVASCSSGRRRLSHKLASLTDTSPCGSIRGCTRAAACTTARTNQGEVTGLVLAAGSIPLGPSYVTPEASLPSVLSMSYGVPTDAITCQRSRCIHQCPTNHARTGIAVCLRMPAGSHRHQQT